jgi:hypothetical protein
VAGPTLPELLDYREEVEKWCFCGSFYLLGTDFRPADSCSNALCYDSGDTLLK